MSSTSLTDALRETLAVFGDSATPLTTTEVADSLDLGRRSTYERLRRLVDTRELRSKKVGASARVWWRSPERTGTGAGEDPAGPETADASDRGEQRRDLERYRAIVETVEDGIYVVDEDGYFTAVNDTYAEMVGRSRPELIGEHVSVAVDDESVHREAKRLERELAAGTRNRVSIEAAVETGDETWVGEVTFGLMETADGYERVGVVRDVTDRKERERTLRDRVRQQEAVAELGEYALETRDLDSLVSWAVDLAAGTLDADYCQLLELNGEELHRCEGVGWQAALVGTETSTAVTDDSQATHTLATADPVVVEDLPADPRFAGSDLLTSHDVRSGVSAVVGGPDDPWGVIGVHDTEPRAFSPDDVTFLQSVAAILATAIGRRRDEQALVRQREQLAALNGLYEVVSEITGAVVEQSTRGEIETVVCEQLAATDSYRSAWIGSVDPESGSVTHRAGTDDSSAGPTSPSEADGYDDVAVGALRSGRVQTLDAAAAERGGVDDWQGGVRSTAVVPLGHEGSVYGVLYVAADRPDAFEGQERSVIAQLGEVVGQAIAAAERKRALIGDDVVELQFRIDDVFSVFDVEGDQAGRITMDHAVPLGDGAFTVYGSATGDGVESLDALVEAVPFWERVRFRTEDETGTRGFELRVTEPPILSALASMAGSVQETTIEGGDLHVTIHASPGVDVRRVTEIVQDSYPDANLLRRRQVSRSDPLEGGELRSTDMTDRQRAALEAAYYAGFFEWPREADGQSVADSFGVAPSTFHQHLRKAERSLVHSFLTNVTRSE